MIIKNLKFQINGGAVSVCLWASASGVSSEVVTALSHGDFIFSIAFNGGAFTKCSSGCVAEVLLISSLQKL